MDSKEKIFHIVYRSVANPELTQDDVEKILKVSRKLNAKAGVSGVLIKRGPIFVQLLEGVEHKVRTIYKRINQDHRHSGVKTLIEAYGDKAFYDNWSMAYVNDPDEHAALKELLPFLDEAASFADNQRQAILPTLKMFSELIDDNA